MNAGEDAELVRRCIDGDREGWDRFVDRFAPYLAGVLRRWLSRRPARVARLTTAEDLLQDCFLHFWNDDRKVLRRYSGASSLETFLRVTAIHHAVNRLESQERYLRSVTPDSRFQAGQGSDGTGLPPSGPGPLQELASREEQERVEEVTARLSPRERLLVRWIGRDGMSYEQAARLLKVAPSSIGPLYSRAVDHLRRLLREKQ